MKKMWKYFLLGALLLLLTGCQDNQKTDDAYDLYYSDMEGRALVPVSYEFTEKDTSACVDEVLNVLQAEVTGNKYRNLLPAGVHVVSHTVVEKKVTVNFNQAYREMENTTEILVRAGFAKSLLGISEVTEVEFQCEGAPMTDAAGNSYAAMNTDTFVENEGKNINSYLYTTLNLYFANADGDKLVKEAVKVYYSSNVPLEKIVVEQLLKGPRGEGDQRTIPADTKILSVSISDNVCYVNLDRAFLEPIPNQNVQEKLPIYSIVNSIMDACQVSKVQISVNGETKVQYRDSVNLDRFFTRDDSLVHE